MNPENILANSLSIIITSDGSHTVRNETTGDTYHSIHGAQQESNHVFIQSGLNFFLGITAAKKIKILEVGFGTGLNAYLTMQAAANLALHVEYKGLEPQPLEGGFTDRLNYSRADNLDFKRLHAVPWESKMDLTPHFSITKIKGNIHSVELQPGAFDLVYYDAFAPKSQPEMWDLEVFKKIKKAMAVPSVFVTYCAKGQVKRDLKTAGFIVESIPGPPGKREMVRALPLA